MFEKLRKTLEGNADALAELKTIEDTSNGNIVAINTLEKQVSDIKATRDKYKQGNATVKSILGLDTVTAETLTEAITLLKGSKGDDASKAEIAKLQEMLMKAGTELQDSTIGYEKKISVLAMDNEISNSGIGANVLNEQMYGIVTNIIKNGASFKDGKVVYIKEDGTTEYGMDNKPLTVLGKMKKIQGDPNYAGLFKPSVNSGGGTPPNNNGNGNNTRLKDGFGGDKKSRQSSIQEMINR